ncbi:MAG: rhamnulokinase [Actinobacteria bacterium]|nr:rhamnulokinase [Actinomycetota bacterium]
MEERSGKPTFGAVDLGADSGRVFTGTFDGTRVELREIHRFPNRPLQLPDGLHWNLAGLFEQALEGLTAAVGESGPLAGVAFDTWAIDYGLLDSRRRLLGLPYHYRDPRSREMVERAATRVPPLRSYQVSGIQAIPINTVYQLLAEEGTDTLAAADRLALVPDLLSYWLSGELANERTVASTTGLVDAVAGTWSAELIEGLGLPARIFGPLIEPGTVLGPVLPRHELGATPVIATASHDTAAAFAAAPAELFSAAAILSSGTWSILGMEVAEPVLTDAAQAVNLSNEAGVEATTRLLKNVMGLWLVQECRRGWAERGEALSFDQLMRLGEAVENEDAALFDPDHPSLLEPGEMPARIAALCAAAGAPAPTDPGVIVRSILLSLACKYRLVLEQLESVVGGVAPCVHVIGGGARNSLLCRLSAELLDRPVLAGPAEASALGNVLVQAIAVGELGSLAEAHEVARASASPQLYEPERDRGRAEATYRRFLDVTGLTQPAPISIERI